MAGDGRQSSWPVENFIDEGEEEAHGGQLTGVHYGISKSALGGLGSKSILRKILSQ